MTREELPREYRSVQAITINALEKEIKEIGVAILANKGNLVENALKMRKEELKNALIIIQNDNW